MIRAGADFSAMKNSMSKAQKDLNSFKKNTNRMLKGIGAVLATIGVGKVIKDGVNAASELEGAMMGLQSILEGQGRSFSRANQFIQEYIDDGLVPLSNAVTAYKNLAARGYDDEQIKNVMNRLKDAAAFGRQASYTLGEAVSSATEGLRQENSVLVDNSGITKNVAKMWEEYARSIGKTANNLTQQEKIQAEVNGIMQETQFQVGDAAKYSNTFAGRLAALSKTMQDIRVNIGQAFIPIISTVFPILQSLANKIATVTAFMAQFTAALFGTSKAVTQSNKAHAQTANAAADAQIGVGKAVEKAGKKAKGALAGFDEINQMQENMNESSGSGAEVDVGGTGIDMGDLGASGGIISEAISNVSAKAQEMADKVRGAFQTVKDMIVESKNIIIPALGAVAGALLGLGVYQTVTGVIAFIKLLKANIIKLVANHPFLLVAVAIGALIGALVAAYMTNDKFRENVNSLFKTIKTSLIPVFQALGDAANWIWQNVLVPVGDFLKTAFVASIEAVSKVGTWLWENVLVPMGDYFLWLWKNVLAPIATVLSDVLAIAFKTVADVGLILWKNVLVPLGDFLKTVLFKAIEGLIEILKHWWNTVLMPISTFLKATFKPAVEIISQAFMFLWSNVLKPLVAFMGGAFVKTFENIGLSVKTIIGGLKNIFTGLIDFITGVFTGNWRKAWDGVKSIFKGVFDSLWGIVKYPLNQIIDGINRLIDGLNKIKFDIPDWIPGFGGKGFGISIPNIPKLAKGGITNGPTLALVGDNPGGKEVVSPLDDLVGIVQSAVVSGIKTTMQMGGGQQAYDRDIVLMVGTTELGRATVRGINRAQRIEGKLLVNI